MRLCASEQTALEAARTMVAFPSSFEAVMKTLRKRAPANLPSAVSDLVAEGGNVLASDDAPVSTPGITYAPARRLHLSKLGQWVAQVIKS